MVHAELSLAPEVHRKQPFDRARKKTEQKGRTEEVETW